jgi:cytochrome P450
VNDIAPDTLDFASDNRYSRFHQRGTAVSWWDYHDGRWMVSGYDEVTAAARDTETFSSRHDMPNGTSPYAGVMVPPTPIRAVPIEMDPPGYIDYRRMLQSRFSPTVVRVMRARTEEFVTWCLDRRIESGRIDLFHDLTKLVPAMITMQLIGLPIEHSEIIADAVHNRSEERFNLNAAWSLLMKVTTEAIARRKQERADDLISYLLDAEIDGHRFADHEIMEICFTLVIGGMATTARLALGGLSYFAVHPEERARVKDDPELMASAIEEFLRYYSPVPFLSRTAVSDTCLGGQEIKAGDRVVLGYAAANRDPKVFDRPDEIIIDRSPNRHLALGHGVHFCLGANLGRMEATVMIEQVLARMPDYELIRDPAPVTVGANGANGSARAKPTNGHGGAGTQDWSIEEAMRAAAAGCPVMHGAAVEEPAPGDAPGAHTDHGNLPWEERTQRGLHVRFTPGKRSGRQFDFDLPERHR